MDHHPGSNARLDGANDPDVTLSGPDGAEQHTVTPNRVNPSLLSSVYEYLQWIGLDKTCRHLLAECPVTLDLVSTQGQCHDVNKEPLLVKMFMAKGVKVPSDSSLGDDSESDDSETVGATEVPVAEAIAARELPADYGTAAYYNRLLDGTLPGLKRSAELAEEIAIQRKASIERAIQSAAAAQNAADGARKAYNEAVERNREFRQMFPDVTPGSEVTTTEGQMPETGCCTANTENNSATVEELSRASSQDPASNEVDMDDPDSGER